MDELDDALNRADERAAQAKVVAAEAARAREEGEVWFDRWAHDVLVPTLEPIVARLVARDRTAEIRTRKDMHTERLDRVTLGLGTNVRIEFNKSSRANQVSIYEGLPGKSSGYALDAVDAATVSSVALTFVIRYLDG